MNDDTAHILRVDYHTRELMLPDLDLVSGTLRSRTGAVAIGVYNELADGLMSGSLVFISEAIDQEIRSLVE